MLKIASSFLAGYQLSYSQLGADTQLAFNKAVCKPGLNRCECRAWMGRTYKHGRMGKWHDTCSACGKPWVQSPARPLFDGDFHAQPGA